MLAGKQRERQEEARVPKASSRASPPNDLTSFHLAPPSPRFHHYPIVLAAKPLTHGTLGATPDPNDSKKVLTYVHFPYERIGDCITSGYLTLQPNLKLNLMLSCLNIRKREQ
jgi:hypothetical protein